MPTAEQCEPTQPNITTSDKRLMFQSNAPWGYGIGGRSRCRRSETLTPMEIEPVSGPRPDDSLTSMGSSPSKKPKQSGRPPQSATSQANAETSRRSSLRNQRSQMKTIRTRKGR